MPETATQQAPALSTNVDTANPKAGVVHAEQTVTLDTANKTSEQTVLDKQPTLLPRTVEDIALDNAVDKANEDFYNHGPSEVNPNFRSQPNLDTVLRTVGELIVAAQVAKSTDAGVYRTIYRVINSQNSNKASQELYEEYRVSTILDKPHGGRSDFERYIQGVGNEKGGNWKWAKDRSTYDENGNWRTVPQNELIENTENRNALVVQAGQNLAKMGVVVREPAVRNSQKNTSIQSLEFNGTSNNEVVALVLRLADTIKQTENHADYGNKVSEVIKNALSQDGKISGNQLDVAVEQFWSTSTVSAEDFKLQPTPIEIPRESLSSYGDKEVNSVDSDIRSLRRADSNIPEGNDTNRELDDSTAGILEAKLPSKKDEELAKDLYSIAAEASDPDLVVSYPPAIASDPQSVASEIADTVPTGYEEEPSAVFKDEIQEPNIPQEQIEDSGTEQSDGQTSSLEPDQSEQNNQEPLSIDDLVTNLALQNPDNPMKGQAELINRFKAGKLNQEQLRDALAQLIKQTADAVAEKLVNTVIKNQPQS